MKLYKIFLYSFIKRGRIKCKAHVPAGRGHSAVIYHKARALLAPVLQGKKPVT